MGCCCAFLYFVGFLVLYRILSELRNRLLNKQQFSKNTKVLISGGLQGIGLELAKIFAREHQSELIIPDIREDLSKGVVQELEKLGSKVTFYHVDLASKEMTQKVFEQIRDKHGPIDILVNNAALARTGSFLDSSLEAYEHTIRVNFMSHIQVTKILLPAMVERNSGHVVNIISLAGLYGNVNLGDYTAGKHAFYGHNTVLRLEMMDAKKNINVTGVFPFFCDTGLFEGCKWKLDNVFKWLKKEELAQRIYKGITYKEKEVLIPADSPYTRPIFMALPLAVMDRFSLNLFGGAFDSFKGREQHKWKKE